MASLSWKVLVYKKFSLPAIPSTAIASSVAAAVPPSHTSPHSTPAAWTSHAVVWLDCHLLDLHILTVAVDLTLGQEAVGSVLLVEGDEAEVLGLGVLAPVNRSLDLDNVAVLQEGRKNEKSVQFHF